MLLKYRPFGTRRIHYGLARINERDGELIEVLEAAQACLFVFFLGLDEHVGQQHLQKLDGIVLSGGLQRVDKRDQRCRSTRFR